MKIYFPPSRYYEFGQPVEITPLTILVGESGTGKTSFASCVPKYRGPRAARDSNRRAYERVLAREFDVRTDSLTVLEIVLVPMIPPGSRGYAYIVHPACETHPRTQAAVGSFLARMVREGRRILVETLCDYLIDRILIEAARDLKLAKKVSLLYFAKKQPICSIKVDRNGNLVDPPKGYRKWFLEEEEARMLGVSD